MSASQTNYSGLVPGVVETPSGDITLNEGRETVTVQVQNLGDRPVQIGSHYHFYEANNALDFEREKTKGFRLNIPAGTATRFEPGQSRTVELVRYAGKLEVYGFQGKVMGKV
ncbi:urease subunit beta [Vibrio astriarenae]|jgi:urease beta subunit|uniref:Urease subunit beta n=1 Tax=Vibrio agarivorans TaxID=153622 RepID=A0ABT7XXC0_9VIBR|nr:urease subunit beta [Vibrio agarivorans]MDN2480432.1 urease subunit beta [Vibrio agarivorans]MDN3662636.1 urease subunit beta [Vibrio agarivorans]